MRGKAFAARNTSEVGRITPAYAGKRMLGRMFLVVFQDHPRLCGEKTELPCNAFVIAGSPPPMRGKVVNGFTTIVNDRITPAYAGKSRDRPFLKWRSWDHPRLCGEKFLKDFEYTLAAGSPPPMRGKGGVNVKFSAQFGITPAYAGKRIDTVQHGRFDQDHPRLCGEKVLSTPKAAYPIGSPPPMRGKVAIFKQLSMCRRITPAYAGKSIRSLIAEN